VSQPPERLGRYEIVKRVGRGGMDTVYLARDPRLNRTVALKGLADFSTSEVHERFVREARATAALRHQHIVTVYDIGEDEGSPFIAMEYVEGETLAAFIARKPPVPADRKLQIATELCAGLLYAHRAGIIHRDVKPGNIMLGEDGAVKILDFGLARWVVDANSLGLTQTGTLMGSPHYMSPEQISGQPVDQRSDIFAVGAVFYELLTYQKAFPGDSMASILHRILSTDPLPVRAVCPDLEPELEAIISKALQKAPENRYPTLQEMLHDLGRVVRLGATNDHAVSQPSGEAAGQNPIPSTVTDDH
jgi:serine/threonine protein kinase